MAHWLDDRLTLPLSLKSRLGFSGRTFFVKHHLAHAASAFYPSGFEEAAVLTVDGVGEWATVTRGHGAGNRLRIDSEMRFPSSLGLLYSAVTSYLGFEVHEGEGTVMGLAAYGSPVFLDRLRGIVPSTPDGGFMLDRGWFDFSGDGKMYTPRFVEAFGPERVPGGPLGERHCDMAASLQSLTEEILLRLTQGLRAQTKCESLCLAGGVALNCVANQKILDSSGFKKVFVQPAAGDAGGSLGAAAFVSHALWGHPRPARMSPYLGPDCSASRIRRVLTNAGLDFRELSEKELCRETAARLARGKVVGWMQGRMEFGPRALGNRSILGDPRHPRMKEIINERVKRREEFRPYAPAVLAEAARDFFELEGDSPFMLFAPRIREEKKSVLPAVAHPDGSARVQTVREADNPRFHRLIASFGELTGVPVVVNTSFNRRGEPMVCAAEEAVAVFKESRMDCLAVGDFFVERDGN